MKAFIAGWLTSGVLHAAGGAVVAYLFHDRLAQFVGWASWMVNRVRGK